MTQSQQAPEQSELVEFLLGRKSEAEQEALADRMFSDPEFGDALDDAEYDLFDAYARGQLPAADRQAFEARLLNSEGQLEKLRDARMLGRFRPSKRRHMLVWLAAAALVIAAFVGWMARPLRDLPATVAPKTYAKATITGPPFAIFLSAGNTRDGAIPEVTLPAGCTDLRFDVELPAGLGAPAAVEINRDRQQVLRETAFTVAAEAGSSVIRLTEPCKNYPPGRYEVVVRAAQGPDAQYQIRLR